MNRFALILKVALLPTLLTCSMATPCYAALPFNIIPRTGAPLPTQVTAGGVVYAFYQVQNNTTTARMGNFVKWLPKNVTQITGDPNYCGATFNLGSVNQPSTNSCILKLAISGTTSPGNTAHDNLLVCFKGGKICAGPYPQNQLNVTAVSGVLNGVAIGSYGSTASGNPLLPLAIITQDGGSDWTTTLSSANIGSGLPADLLLGTPTTTKFTSFYQTKCSTAGICIAVGDYASSAAGNAYYPNISYSSNYGVTWTSVVDSAHLSAYPSNFFPSPNSEGDDYYTGGTCSGNECIAAGQYQTTTAGNPMYPFITVSQNGGITWFSAVDSTTGNLPSDINTSYTAFTENAYYAVACSSSVCMAAGDYLTTGGLDYPLITVSQNGGTTWTTTVSSSTSGTSMPSDYATSDNKVIFNAATCEGSYCNAVGRYKSGTNAHFYPLLIASSNNGTTWTPIIGSSSIGTGLPSDLKATTGNVSTLLTTNCSGSTCVAGGFYQTTSGVNYPLLIVSTNGGQSFSPKVYSGSLGTAALPADYPTVATSTNEAIKSATCSGNICIAAGYYPAGTAQNVYPLLIVSQDGGNTWVVKISSSSVGIGLPSNIYASPTTKNYLSNVSCSGNYCIAGGQYYTSASTFVPLVVVSHDGGSNWLAVVDSMTTSALPRDFLTGVIGFAENASGVSIPSNSFVDFLNEKTQSPYNRLHMLNGN